MEKNKIVMINGQPYDAHTGMPLLANTAAKVVAPQKPTVAASVHGAPQKSKTLVRRATKKPVPSAPSQVRKTPGRMMDIARSGKIARFAPHPVAAPAAARTTPDIPAVMHPVVSKAHAAHIAKKSLATKQPQKSPTVIKNEAIKVALEKPAVSAPKKKLFSKRNHRKLHIFAVSLALVLIAGYLTYHNMPSLSVRVAASQAGINATYPEYRPDGYRLDGPVAFNDGQVTIHFRANTGDGTFTVTQAKSSWDSSAVLDNIVRKSVDEKYITNHERGLTIYTYNGNAAWVNAGILYTIEGNAPLSGEQIRRIATSL